MTEAQRIAASFNAARWKLDESIRVAAAAFRRLAAVFPPEMRTEFRKYERRVERAQARSRAQTRRRRGHGRQ